jgi:hypothetical protein
LITGFFEKSPLVRPARRPRANTADDVSKAASGVNPVVRGLTWASPWLWVGGVVVPVLQGETPLCLANPNKQQQKANNY